MHAWHVAFAWHSHAWLTSVAVAWPPSVSMVPGAVAPSLAAPLPPRSVVLSEVHPQRSPTDVMLV